MVCNTRDSYVALVAAQKLFVMRKTASDTKKSSMKWVQTESRKQSVHIVHSHRRENLIEKGTYEASTRTLHFRNLFALQPRQTTLARYSWDLGDVELQRAKA